MNPALNEKGPVENTWRFPDRDLGYMFSPPCNQDYPRHRQIDIAIHAVPTLHHYDPESAQFPIFSDFWGYEVLKVQHPWKRGEKYRVIPGVVIMNDRVDKKMEAFTFGGKLQIENENDCTMCSMKSSAPILPLDIKPSVSTLLAEEVEIILAERREAWDEEHPRTDFEEHLADIDPLTFYFSCLDTLQANFSQFHHPDPEIILQFRHYLKVEIQTMKNNGLWPMYLPSIEKLL